MSKKAILTLFVLVFMSLPGCSASSPKAEKADKRIPLTEIVRIAVIPALDRTKPQELENWPTPFQLENPATSLWEDLQKEFTNKIGLYSPTHKIEIVHQSQKPNYRVQLLFKELKYLDSGLELIAEVRVYDQNSVKGDFSVEFSAKGNSKFDAQSKQDIYAWGKAFEQIRRHFPYSELLAKLFFSPENKGTI